MARGCAIIDMSKGREQTGRPRRGREEHTMFYMSLEEYLITMTDEELADIMADCYADEAAGWEEI